MSAPKSIPTPTPPYKIYTPFCVQNQEPPKCPEKTVGKTGSNVCDQTAKWAAKAAIQVSDNLSRMMPFTAFMKGITSESSSMQSTINELQTRLKSIAETEQYSRCNARISQVQSNSIIAGIPPECTTNFDSLRPELQDKILKGGNISNVTQINTADAQNLCKIDLVIKALTEMEASIDNSTLQSVMNHAKGILAKTTSEQDICNNIGIEMTACKYINQTQCCDQEIVQEQTNLLETKCGGSISNVIQSNTASARNQCMLSASAAVSDIMKAKIKNIVTQEAQNTAEGLTLDFFIIIIIIFCLLFGAPILMFKYIFTKIFYIIGAIFIVAGIICGVIYITSKKSETTRYNKPYSGCTSFRSLRYNLTKATLGEAKQFVKDNNNVLGYDFFVVLPIDPDTNEKVKPSQEIASNTTDEALGTVLYMTVKPKGGETCHVDEESIVISYAKSESKPRFLIISILLLIVGTFCIGIGMFKDYQNSKPVVPLAKTDPLAKLKPLASTFMNKFSKPTTAK